MTQERLQFFGNEIRTNRSRGVLENKILSKARAENFEWASCMDNISSKSCSTIFQCEVWVSVSERYAFAPFCHCIGRVLIKFLRLVFELVGGWSIANSPRLVEGWATGGWLFFPKKEHFLLDSRFSLHFPKMFKTVYQARGFFGARAAACGWSRATEVRGKTTASRRPPAGAHPQRREKSYQISHIWSKIS